MRASITAILVIREGGDHLTECLTAITTQTRAPHKLVLVDSSADSTIASSVEPALRSTPFVWSLKPVPYQASFAEAVVAGMEVAFGDQDGIREADWVWLLRDDSAPSDTALERLVEAVESAPLIKIAGPKQRARNHPGIIREMGETMTRFGERMALAERERDQAQYDRLSDVLAVGEVGMLIQAMVFRDLGGFDNGLKPLDGGLDLCVRARLAGHRVVVVPRAVLHVGAGPADWSARKRVSGITIHILARRSWLYRRLVYAPPWLLPLLLVWVVPWGLVRASAQLLLKRPDKMASEIVAAVGVLLKLAPIVRARQVLASNQMTTWATIDSLRLDPVDVRKRKSIARETLRAKEEEHVARNPLPALFPSLPWLILALTAASGIVFGRWWGADYLQGGSLIPLVETASNVWDGAWVLPSLDYSSGSEFVPADPAGFLFAALGTLTWWNPNFSLTVLFLTAIPLAGAVAWWGFSQILTKAWTTTLASFIWAVSPSLLLALSEGRVGAVLALIALPWLLGALVSAHESWQRVGQAALATVVVTASTPTLWPLVVLGAVVTALSRSLSHPLRMVVGVIPLVLGPALLLSLPRFLAWWELGSGRWWEGWGVLFADPGSATPFDAAPWWLAVVGWPQEVPDSAFSPGGLPAEILTLVVPAMGAVLIVLALSSLLVGQSTANLIFGLLSAAGLVAATVSPTLFSGYQGAEAVFVWPGVAVGVLLLGLIVGAGSALDGVEFHDSLGNPRRGLGPLAARVAGGAVLLTALVAPGLIAVQAWTGQVGVQAVSASRTLPAFVSAEAAQSPQVGTLIITARDESYLVTLERGAGATLMESSTLIRGRDIGLAERDEDLARLAAMLVQPSSADPAPILGKYGISFILLRDAPDSAAALTLAQRPESVSASVSDSGQLWQVVTPSALTDQGESGRVGLAGYWFLGLLAIAAILAVPTERRARESVRPLDDAVPALGEETSDDL